MPYLKKATDAPFGLMPHTAPLRLNTYPKAAAMAIFRGDVVELLSTGLVGRLADVAGRNRLIIGVAAETTTTASAATSISVYDHPDQLYVCQEDSVGTYLQATHLGNLFSVTGLSPAASQEAAGVSITQMDTSTTTATITADSVVQFIKMHGIEGTTFPTATGDPRKVVVKFIAGTLFYATQSGAI